MIDLDHVEYEDEGALLLRSRDRTGDAEMDITPMIDITFLLLIFFLVCSTPDQQGGVELPQARYGKGVGENESVIITIKEGGIDSAPVFLSGEATEVALTDDLDLQQDLIREAVEKGRGEGKENVIIKADRNVAHRDVSRVIKAISKVEGSKIHLAVLEAD